MSRQASQNSGVPGADPAHQLLDACARQWRQRRGLSGGLVALGLWLPLAALVFAVSRSSVVIAISGTLVLGGIAFAAFWRWWRGRPSHRLAVAAQLDRCVPGLEHSGELLAASASALGPVARMQRVRALRVLAAEPRAATLLPSMPLAIAARWLALSIGVAAAIGLGWPRWIDSLSARGMTSPSAVVDGLLSPADGVLATRPTIDAVVLEVEAPRYTQLGTRRETVIEAGTAVDSAIEVPDGSRLTWQVSVSGELPAPEADEANLAPANHDAAPSSTDDPGSMYPGSMYSVEVVWTDQALSLVQAGAGLWQQTEVVREERVFHIELRDEAGKRVATTPYVRLAVVADAPPRVTVVEPPLEVEISPADGLALRVRGEISDDYGVAGTSLIATLALGAGEMVQFREQRFDLRQEAVREDGTRVVGRVLDLQALGLEPGGELYFFLEAWDNHPDAAQRTRSATHVARWPGGETGTVSLDSGLPMILPPETFRSQRQIIIDTERLIAERSELDAATLARRARQIAMDQQALRLRYGAILGDEFVDGRPVGPGSVDDGHDHPKAHHDDAPGSPAEDHPHDHGRAAANGGLSFGDEDTPRTTRLIDLVGELEGDLVHAHDSEESATFFATETKRTLKSSLANMWEAELRLHLADPEGALPYEYRALRLLKEVQQASRVYVRRVGFGTPPLDPGRRFTGELDDIRTRRPRQETEKTSIQPAARRALAALETEVPEAGAARVLADRLRDAATELAGKTVGEGEPAVDLGLLEMLRAAAESLRAGSALTPDQRAGLIAGLWRGLSAPVPVPDRRTAAPSPLWEHYRAAVSGTGGLSAQASSEADG